MWIAVPDRFQVMLPSGHAAIGCDRVTLFGFQHFRFLYKVVLEYIRFTGFWWPKRVCASFISPFLKPGRARSYDPQQATPVLTHGLCIHAPCVVVISRHGAVHF